MTYKEDMKFQKQSQATTASIYFKQFSLIDKLRL